jgi:hypothetical protein
MGGGLLNIISYGNQNIILNGNPSKTFFKSVYAKYSNFGIQNMRIDYTGLKNLSISEDSVFTFKIPRNAELLLDTFLVFNLPDIWSPVMPPAFITDKWKTYNFRWINNIGTNIIKKITISIGGQIIQSYSGQYIRNVVDRDYESSKKELFNKMIGMTTELTNPEAAYNRANNYPNAYYAPDDDDINNVGPEPSIRGRKIYVPLNFWFSHSSKVGLPLVALQYSEVVVDIILRPIIDLYKIYDVSADPYVTNAIKPQISNTLHSLYRFLSPPTTVNVVDDDYPNKNWIWNTDIHIIGTYCFLSEEESTYFASQEHKYLIKDVKEDVYHNTNGTKKIKIFSSGLASSWLWYFQRTDVGNRNEWSNYTNWQYNFPPFDIINAPETDVIVGGVDMNPYNNYILNTYLAPGAPPSYVRTPTFIKVTQKKNNENVKQIMNSMSILFDGKYRENELDSGIYNYIEKYNNSKGDSDDGLYTYNYCLHTSSSDLQPSGAINLSKFKNIEIEFNTIIPPFDPTSEFIVVCDQNGTPVGTTKSLDLFIYNYDLHFTEERYNILRFLSGYAGLLYAR